MLIELLIFLVTSLLAYYVYVYKKIHWHYDNRGLKYIPGVPIFGNVLKSTFLRRHMFEDLDAVYKEFPDEKYVGFLEGVTPILLIRNPDLIKSVTVKNFDHFMNHKKFFDEETEPLFGGSLLMMDGERWRDMRMTLSPAFTGSKMRHMLPFMVEISNNLVEYLKDHQSEDMDVEDLIRRYTNDVIASAAYGLRVNSFKDKENEFFVTGQNLFKFNWWQRFIFFVSIQFPAIGKVFGGSIFPKKTTEFFRDLVRNTMEYRRKNNIERPDMIQLLMEASEGKLKNADTEENDSVGFATVNEELKHHGHTREWTENELIGQVFIFFVAGFESSASALVMCVHELAINPNIQETLYQEIREFKETKETLSYDNVSVLKYLDNVLNETLRKWSPAVILDRICNKEFILPPPREGGDAYRVNPGDVVYNFVNSLHMDPKYFPDPEKFDPDRFLDENKHNIKPFTYMPFGMGPRNCIGSRFALLELKVLLYNLVLNYKILKVEKTADPIKLKTDEFNLKSQGGSWVRFQARE
ncbi:probable cytochrome P450 9f2 [Manduca sexta]|uniref:unspecific monooxygenase n=1 Tax=Manduca sexta TaxID=7130 RepID=A0A922CV46_MANSE|nr:probable cytochrome P450 9f2 [Manduca sexta]KAG6460655.1 hypothetical protein O3G_MSEX012130 [Manduca sexta]